MNHTHKPETVSLFRFGKLSVSNSLGVSVIALMILAFIGSIYATYRLLQTPQTIATQASEIFASHAAYASGEGNSFVFSATTSEPAAVYLHIDPYDSFIAAMNTENQVNHSVFITDLPDGEYTYYFTAETKDVTSQSDAYPFVVPQFAEEE